MTEQWKHLFKIELLQKYGLNEARYSKDKSKKRKLALLGFCYILISIMLIVYVCLGAFGLCAIGAEEILMPYLFAITSMIIFFFSVFRAGSVIFQMETYELLISLPVSIGDIVVSRFFSMYVGNLVISMLVMIPACIIYSMYASAGMLYWGMIFVSILLLPLFPILMATVIGTIVTAVGARVKYKNLITIILSMLFIIAVLVLSFLPSYLGRNGQLNSDSLMNITEMLKSQVNHMYIFAPLFTKALMEQNLFSFLAFVVIYIGCFAFFIWVIQRYFLSICNILSAHQKRGNYQIGSLQVSSPFMALYKKEWKRYLSSNIYVMNTAMAYIMMFLFAGSVLVIGKEKMGELIGISGIIEMFSPLLLAWMTTMGALTATSISMEGKNWWLPMSLPISFQQIMNSKIMVNLTLAVPSCLISACLLWLGLKTEGIMVLWLFITPLIYSVFTAVFGIFINLKFPLFNWNNETSVIKQSGASFMSVLTGFIVVGIPFVLLIFVRVQPQILMPIINIILLGVTIGVYLFLQTYDPRKING